MTGTSPKNKDFDNGVFEGVGEPKLLKPGESYETLIPISRACDMADPGEYMIHLSRVNPLDPKPQLVKSNSITITRSSVKPRPLGLGI